MIVKLIDLARKILVEHTDPSTRSPEAILMGYSSNEIASVHLLRYVLGSKLAHGFVLDCASGSCYGSSILRRSNAVKSVISVDIDRDILQYGKMIYNDNCVHADATHLPFKEMSFDSVVSIETLEHMKDQKSFLSNIKFCLKQNGRFILSTPNKLYISPFTPKPMNPYHMNEYYLGPLLILLESQGFKVRSIYGGRKIGVSMKIELIRRIFGSFLKSLLDHLIKLYLIDDFYDSFLNHIRKKKKATMLVDPDLSMFRHEELKATSNILLYEYFMIVADKSQS